MELIYVVFSFLDGKELMILGQVCSLLYEIAQDESLWKGLAERLWPTSIALGQKPENRSWKWLYKAKTVRLIFHASIGTNSKCGSCSAPSARTRYATVLVDLFCRTETSMKVNGATTRGMGKVISKTSLSRVNFALI